MLVVFAIVFHDVPPFSENSHLIIDPVLPLSVNVPLFELAQTFVIPGEIDPPEGDGKTVIDTVAVSEHPEAPPITV